MNKIIIGTYWGPREESREESGIRLARFFELLSAVEPSLAKWQLLGPNESILGTDKKHTSLALRDLYSVENEDPPVDPSLGRRFRGWTPKGSSFATLSGCLGSTQQNNVLIITREGEFTDEHLRSVLNVMVEVFDPDDAMLNGGDMLASAYARLNKAQLVGQYPPLSQEPAWCNYKRGTPLLLQSFSRERQG
jgi:hypothetical protein